MLILQRLTPFHRNVFNKLVYEEDLKAIKLLYIMNGYPWVEINEGKTTIDAVRNVISQEIVINEGPQVVVNEVSFHGNQLFDDSQLLKQISLQPGSYFSEKKWGKTGRSWLSFILTMGMCLPLSPPKQIFKGKREQ